jgi:hypothetical protein
VTGLEIEYKQSLEVAAQSDVAEDQYAGVELRRCTEWLRVSGKSGHCSFLDVLQGCPRCFVQILERRVCLTSRASKIMRPKSG